MGAAALAAINLAIEALKQLPDFDEKKLQSLERARDSLNSALIQEDSDLILHSVKKIENLSTTYKDLL